MKKFYRENRVFSIMMMVAFIAIASILGFFYIYFFHGSGTDKYGTRLDDIKNVKLDKKKFTEIKEELVKEPNVLSVSIELEGKILYSTIDLNKEAAKSDGINVSLKILNFFTEAEQDLYDFSFVVNKKDKEEEETYPFYGYKNSETANIVWTKY